MHLACISHVFLIRFSCILFPQLARYTFPFMFISAVFWLLHTWLLDPMPNAFKRKEFIRYRWGTRFSFICRLFCGILTLVLNPIGFLARLVGLEPLSVCTVFFLSCMR